MEKVDVTIIGAGVIGLAVAEAVSKHYDHVFVLERHDRFGMETSSRNSEVIHAGLYYQNGSLKLSTCVRGNRLLYELCDAAGIAYRKTGKLLVATTEAEEKGIHAIYDNACACGVENLRFLSQKELDDMEPDISVAAGFFSPDSGIIDSHGLMKYLYDSAITHGCDFVFSVDVTGIEKDNTGYCVTAKEPTGEDFSFQTQYVINCAGLHADAVAALAGFDIDEYEYRLHYNKGQYFRLAHPDMFSISHLVYPPPTATSLGIHITPDLGGGLRLGPDTQYVSKIDYGIDENAKQVFFESVRTFLPGLQHDDLIPDTAGVRPKLQGRGQGARDFVVSEESDKGYPHFINCIGIESPGLTGSLVIAEMVRDMM